MGLWTRMKRSVRALFGGIIEKTEDPELILQQTIRDMRDRVPELNNSVAQVMATENVDPSRIYVTGVSMGGMVAIIEAAIPVPTAHPCGAGLDGWA